MVHQGFAINQAFQGLEVANGKIFFLYYNTSVPSLRHPMVWMKPVDLSSPATILIPAEVCRAADIDGDLSTGTLFIACSCPTTDTCSQQSDFWPERSLVLLDTHTLSWRQLNLINPLRSISWNPMSRLLFGVGKANYLAKLATIVVNVIDIERRVVLNVVVDEVTSPTNVLVDISTGLTYLQSAATGLMVLPQGYGCPRGFEFHNGDCMPCKFAYAQSINGNPNATFPRCIACSSGYIATSTGSIKCDACTPGTFQEQVTKPQYCNVCQPGTISTGLASTNCTACSPGRYAPDVKLTVCLLCEPGTFSADSGASSCLPCSRGEAATLPIGATSCSSCLPGTFSSDQRQTNCTQCPPGSYSDLLGSTSCLPCSLGQYSSEVGRSHPCDSCPAGTSQPLPGQTACQPCALGTYSETSAATCTVCSVTSYTPQVGARCVSCTGANQDGLDCNNGLAAVRPDYWAYLEPSEEHGGILVYRTAKCPLDHCPGSQLQAVMFNTSESTNTGDSNNSSSRIAVTPRCIFPRLDSADNFLCAVCIESYLPWGPTCRKCDEIAGGWMALVVVFSIALVLFLLKSGSSSAGHIAILLFFIQIASLEIGSVSRALTFLKIFNLGSDSISACLAPLTPLKQTLLTLLTPFWLIGILSVVASVHYAMHRSFIRSVERLDDAIVPSADSDTAAAPVPISFRRTVSQVARQQFQSVRSSFTIDMYIGCALSILLFCYTSVSLAVVKALDCQEVAPGVRLLFSAPTVSCSAAEYHAFLPIVIVWLSVYILGFPIGLLVFPLAQA